MEIRHETGFDHSFLCICLFIYLFSQGFLSGLKQENQIHNSKLKSLVLLRPKVKSSVGAAILGAKSVGEKFPVDYSQNMEIFFTYTVT